MNRIPPQFPSFYCWLLLLICPIVGMGQSIVADPEANAYQQMQQHKVDSLKALTFEDPVAEIENLREVLALYRDLNLDSALFYAKKQLAMSEAIPNEKQIAYSRMTLANIYFQMDDLETAKELLLLNRNSEAPLEENIMAQTENALGMVFISLAVYDQAIEASMNAAQLFEALKDSTNAGFSYISLAEVYMVALEDYKLSEKHIQKAIQFLRAKKANKEHLVAALLAYGDISVRMKNYEQGLALYLESKELSEKNDVFWYLSSIFANLGKVYYFKKEYQTAIHYLEQSVEKAGDSELALLRAYRYLGLSYREMGEADKAIPYFEYCEQREKTLAPKIDILEYLIVCYIQLEDYKKAFEIQQQLQSYQDSLHARDESTRVTEIIEKYENEKKQLEIEQLNAENEQKANFIDQQLYLLWGAVGLFLLLGIAGYFWLYTRQKLKDGINKLENAQLQQRFLRVQLNPHFFFHALSSIEGYIYTNEKESAAAFLRNFSKLMRNILESSDQDFIALEEDIDTICEYFVLQQLNSEFKFDFTVEVSEELSPERIMIPPMLIQPFIENAILHGALNVEKGIVSVDYRLKQDNLQIEIRDNGPGPSSANRKSGTLLRSMGLDIVQQRIRNLKEIYGIEIRYRLLSAAEGKTGTTVIVDIPTKLTESAIAQKKMSTGNA